MSNNYTYEKSGASGVRTPKEFSKPWLIAIVYIRKMILGYYYWHHSSIVLLVSPKYL